MQATSTLAANALTHEQILANFIHQFALDQAAPEAVQTVKWVLLAVLGVGLAGATEEGIDSLRELLLERGGKPQAKTLHFGDKLPATSVAQLGGAMCRALDYCDAMAPGPHFGSAIVPAAYAVLQSLPEERRPNGKQLLEALIVGAEIGGRFNLSEKMYDGFDPTGVAAVFAATATATRLMQLSPAQTVNALGLAFNRCGGSFQSNVDGTLAVRLVQGFVAETGVWCAQMAAKGLTGPHRFLSGHYGFCHLFARGLRAPESFTQHLGKEWFLQQIVFKKFPSCGVTQGVTQLTLNGIQALQLGPENFEAATVSMPPYSVKLVGNPFVYGENPRVNAQFSAQYCVANVIARGSSRLDHFRPEQIANELVQNLISKVSIESHPTMDVRGHSSVDLQLKRTDGQVWQSGYDVSPGFPGNGLSAAEHAARFDDCIAYAGLAWSDAQREAFKFKVNQVEHLNDPMELWPVSAALG